MAKLKFAASLIDLNAKQYAILAPGVGYFKNRNVPGVPRWVEEGILEGRFEDNLPRASGCFETAEEANALRTQIIEWNKAKLEEAIHKQTTQYWIKLATRNLNNANNSVIVELTVRQVPVDPT